MTAKEERKTEELEDQLEQNKDQSEDQEDTATKEEKLDKEVESPVESNAEPVIEKEITDTPESEPTTEDAAAEQAEEIPESEPVVEEAAAEKLEEEPVVEEKTTETPAPVVEEEPIVEEVAAEQAEEIPESEPVVEEAAAEKLEEEPVVEEKTTETPAPVVEEESVVEEKTTETPAPVGEEEPIVKEVAAEQAKEIPESEPVVEEAAAEKLEEEPVFAEKTTETPEQEPELPPLGQDYSNSTKEELVGMLRLLLDRRIIQEIRKEVDNIKSAFYKRHRFEIEEKRKSFIENGGAPEEFLLPPDPLEEEYKELYDSYRIRRTEYFKVLEEEKGKNLLKKREIIDRIEHLINSQESLNKTFNEFRDLQREWRDVGPVPQSSLRQLWESYHYHVEKFYDFIKINKELRDLDLKKNLEIKLALCEKAEELLLEPSVIKAFKDLQELHARWRETGPVPIDKKEEIWDRFKEATTKINKSHQDHFQHLKKEQKTNLESKIRLCEHIEEILTQGVSTPNKWNEYSREVVDLQKLWRTIGFAPKRDNNKVYDRFRTGCDAFFNMKREFFNSHREVQNTNMQLKNELCIQAESLMKSSEWKQVTEDLISIQREWKKIGPVPRKYSDALWKRFRTACDTFFQNKNDHFKGQGSAQVENLKRKHEIIESIKNYSLGEDHNKDLSKLQQFQKEFLSIGYVPFSQKENIAKEFRDAINSHFDKLDIDESKRELLKFRQKIDNLAQSPNNRNRIEAEREKLESRLKLLENDVILWENNIGFFAKSEKSDSLRKEVERKIKEAKERIVTMKDKLGVIDNYDY